MVKDWMEIDEPWFLIEGFPQIILDKVSFLDILDEYEVEYWVCYAGEFTHRARCPLPIHDFGAERTASFFINEETNKFYCFGCNSGGNLIDFVKYSNSVAFDKALEYLSNFINLEGVDLEKFDGLPKKRKRSPEEKVETHVFRAGVIIRDYLASIKDTPEYAKRCSWANKQFKRLDTFLAAGDEACVKAKAYAEKLPDFLRGKHK